MEIPYSFCLFTENLKLRLPSEEDFPHIFSATRYKGFNDGMLWEPPESMEELIKPLENALSAWKMGDAFGFAIEEKESGVFSGRISIRKTQEVDIWNVGFWTHPEQQGRGIMSEALGAILQFGFDKLEANRIEAAHAIWNKASERVLMKNGFEFVRYLEHGFMKRGEWVAENLLAIDKEIWLM